VALGAPLSLEAYASGVIGEDDPGPPEDVSFGIGDEEDEVVEELEEGGEDDGERGRGRGRGARGSDSVGPDVTRAHEP
jgi:hypothetical protein